MGLSPSDIKTLLSMGSEGVLIFFLIASIAVLWKVLEKKDKLLDSEREKRELLISEQIKISTSLVDYIKNQSETLRDISEALRRVEVGKNNGRN